MELRLVVATLLRSFRFSLESNFVKKDFFLTLKPIDVFFHVERV